MRALLARETTDRILRSAIEVHGTLGPGLLESTYRTCLAWEMRQYGLEVEEEVRLALKYKSLTVAGACRIDLLVEGKVIVELKTVERLLPIHEAQLLTYLRLSGVRVGLLMNFDATLLKQGIRRLVV